VDRTKKGGSVRKGDPFKSHPTWKKKNLQSRKSHGFGKEESMLLQGGREALSQTLLICKGEKKGNVAAKIMGGGGLVLQRESNFGKEKKVGLWDCF